MKLTKNQMEALCCIEAGDITEARLTSLAAVVEKGLAKHTSNGWGLTPQGESILHAFRAGHCTVVNRVVTWYLFGE